MLVNWYECGQQAARIAKLRNIGKSDWIPICRQEYDGLRRVTASKKSVEDYREFTHGFWNVMSDGEFYKR